MIVLMDMESCVALAMLPFTFGIILPFQEHRVMPFFRLRVPQLYLDVF